MSSAESAILTYHSLDESGSVISVSPGLFRRQMESLARRGIPVVPLAGLLRGRGAFAITFDDGFLNFAEHGLPVLARLGFPATVFVVSGHCGGRNDWPSRVRGRVPNLELMGWPELRELPKAGIEVGAHGVRHEDLTRLPADAAEREMDDCRREIEDRLGVQADSFAYPFGSSNPRVRDLARRHFRIACGTELRFTAAGDDPLWLPRIDAYYLRSWDSLEPLATARGRMYIAGRGLLRGVRARLAGRRAR